MHTAVNPKVSHHPLSSPLQCPFPRFHRIWALHRARARVTAPRPTHLQAQEARQAIEKEKVQDKVSQRVSTLECAPGGVGSCSKAAAVSNLKPTMRLGPFLVAVVQQRVDSPREAQPHDQRQDALQHPATHRCGCCAMLGRLNLEWPPVACNAGTTPPHLPHPLLLPYPPSAPTGAPFSVRKPPEAQDLWYAYTARACPFLTGAQHRIAQPPLSPPLLEHAGLEARDLRRSHSVGLSTAGQSRKGAPAEPEAARSRGWDISTYFTSREVADRSRELLSSKLGVTRARADELISASGGGVVVRGLCAASTLAGWGRPPAHPAAQQQEAQAKDAATVRVLTVMTTPPRAGRVHPTLVQQQEAFNERIRQQKESRKLADEALVQKYGPEGAAAMQVRAGERRWCSAG